MRKVGGILTGLFHIVGLVALACLCLVRYMQIEGLYIIKHHFDIILIVASIALIIFHYFVSERLYSHKIRTWIFTITECLLAGIIFFLVIVPNDFVNIRLYDGLIILIVQLLIVSARVVSSVRSYRTANET